MGSNSASASRSRPAATGGNGEGPRPASGKLVTRVGLPGGNGDGHYDLMTWPVADARTPDGHGDCPRCRGRCCTYVTVSIDKPRRKVDVDEIRWFLAHENIQVFIEDGDWYVQFYTPCRHLTADGLCAIYADRFDVCREHKTRECEMSEGVADAVVFSSTGEFDAWWAERKRRKAEKKSRHND